jgi:hypothetical protein
VFKLVLTAAMIGVLPTIAFAAPCPAIGCGFGHTAPAPLLAAGIPAFIALGGGAGIVRLLRRRRMRAQVAAAPVRSASDI